MALLSNYLVKAFHELVITSGELSRVQVIHLVIKDFGCLTRLPHQRLAHVKQTAETSRK